MRAGRSRQLRPHWCHRVVVFDKRCMAAGASQIGVYDPNSASRSARRWGVVEVLNEIEAMWAYY